MTTNRKLVTGVLAASLLLSGGLVGLLHSQAFADPAAATGNNGGEAGGNGSVNGGPGGAGAGHGGHAREPAGDLRSGGHRPGPGFAGGDVLKETATLLGVEPKTIMDEQKQGKTLAQIAQEKAGLSEDAYLQKLADAETKALDDAVSAGKLTKDQADRQKSGLNERLKDRIESNRPAGGPGPGFGKGGRHDGFVTPQVLSQITGLTEQELGDALKAGKSLADIAQEKGLSEDQLIGKIKDGMTDQLKQFVERKGGDRPRGAAPAAGGAAPSAAGS